MFDDEAFAAEHDALAPKRAYDAVRDDIFDVCMFLAMLETLFERLVDHGACQRMRKVLFQAGGEPQCLVPAPSAIRHDAFHLGGGRRERSGLVEDDGVGLGHMVEVARSLHHETVLRAFALRRHDRDGAGKPQGARVIDHKRSRHLGQVARHERDGSC